MNSYVAFATGVVLLMAVTMWALSDRTTEVIRTGSGTRVLVIGLVMTGMTLFGAAAVATAF